MTTITCPQLVHTSKPGHGFVTLSSGTLTVDRDRLALLEDPVAADAKSGFDRGLAVTRVAGRPTDFVAVTYASGAQDEFRRPFIHTHTILVPLDAYVSLEANLRLLRERFITTPDGVTSSSELAPVELAFGSGMIREVADIDLALISTLLPLNDDLAKLISTHLSSGGSTLRLVCDSAEAIDFLMSMLRVLPQAEEPLEAATFQARTGLSQRYKLVVFPIAGRVVSGPRRSVVETRPSTPIKPEARTFAEAILSKRVEEVTRIRTSYLHDDKANRLFTSIAKAIAQRRWADATDQLGRLQEYLKTADSALAPSVMARSRNRHANLFLDMAAGRQDSLSLLSTLRAGVGTVLSSNEARDRVNKLLEEKSANAAFKISLVVDLLQEESSREWLASSATSVILDASPVKLFMNVRMDIRQVVHLLHAHPPERSRTDDIHLRIAAWLCSFDFEEELFRFRPSSTDPPESFLTFLLNMLHHIAGECSRCATLVVHEYLKVFNSRLIGQPPISLGPRLRARRFHSVEEFQKAVERSGVLDALAQQIERLDMKRQSKDLDKVRKRLQKLKMDSRKH